VVLAVVRGVFGDMCSRGSHLAGSAHANKHSKTSQCAKCNLAVRL
jgi:hypothetical protein